MPAETSLGERLALEEGKWRLLLAGWGMIWLAAGFPLEVITGCRDADSAFGLQEVAMERYPKTLRLKDGQQVTVRPMVENDFDQLFAFFQSLPAEDRLFLKSDVTDREVVARWVKSIDYDSVLPILAFSEKVIVADATLHLNRHGWLRKSGEVRCVVARRYQRSGLGTLLVHELVEQAAARGIERLVSQITTDQRDAVRMFERVGFKREAVLPKHVLDVSGRWRDLVIMTNNTSEIWREMEDLLLDLDLRRG